MIHIKNLAFERLNIIVNTGDKSQPIGWIRQDTGEATNTYPTDGEIQRFKKLDRDARYLVMSTQDLEWWEGERWLTKQEVPDDYLVV